MIAENDQWVVVSGGGGALGSALAKHYAGRGRKVLAVDRKFDEDSQSTPSVTSLVVDLLIEGDVQEALTKAIAPKQSIGLLINAVGQIWNEPILTLQGAKLVPHGMDSWRAVTDANLTAPFVVAAQVAALMVRRGGGSIVNFSSIASGGNAGQAAYSAAKAGIEGLTRTMAAELGPLGVRANAIALGFIDVATTKAAVVDKRLQQHLKETPVGRLGRVEDVISAIEFLETNTFANGSIVRLDGGLRL